MQVRDSATDRPWPAALLRFLGDIDRQYLHLATNDNLGEVPRSVRPTLNYHASYTGSARSLNSLRKPTAGGSRPFDDFRQRAAERIQPTVMPSAERTAASESATAGERYIRHNAASLEAGMRIEHAKFGLGTIEAVDNSGPDARITVNFDSSDTRTLMLKFAKFAIVS